MKRGQSIETITLEEALELFVLPRNVGTLDNKELVVSIGKFGPYVRFDGRFFSLDKTDDPYSITKERCVEIIETKLKAEAKKKELEAQFPKSLGGYKDEDVVVNIGKYGPYITHSKKNYKIPKDFDPLMITLDEAVALINKPTKKK